MTNTQQTVHTDINDVKVIPGTPEKTIPCKKGTGIGGLLPAFQILLRPTQKKIESAKNSKLEHKILREYNIETPPRIEQLKPKVVPLSLEKQTIVNKRKISPKVLKHEIRLLSDKVHIKNMSTKRKSSSTSHVSKKAKMGKVNSGVSHGIKKPKTNYKRNVLTQADLNILLKKKGCLKQDSNEWNDEESDETMQDKLAEILDNLNEETTISYPNDIAIDTETDEQLIKIQELINIVGDGHENITHSTEELNENDIDETQLKQMDDLLDKIIGSTYEDSTSSSCTSCLNSTFSEEELDEIEDNLNKSDFDYSNDIDPFDDLCDNDKNEITQNISGEILFYSGENTQQPDQSSIKSNDSDKSEENNNKKSNKLFPIFMRSSTSPTRIQISSPGDKQSPIIRMRKLPLKDTGGKEQMIIDAGQKKFGIETCMTCGFLYDPDSRSDVDAHFKFHNRNSAQIKYMGWKNERVIVDYGDKGKIIMVQPGDPLAWWRRVATILSVVNNDLGFLEDIINFSNIKYKVFLYVYKKSIVSCIVAENITKANKMINETEATEESFPAICGITRIWTTALSRKQGFAAKLMNALRENFLSYRDLELNEIAFSSPSTDGRAFATKYFDTPNFLVY